MSLHLTFFKETPQGYVLFGINGKGIGFPIEPLELEIDGPVYLTNSDDTTSKTAEVKS